MYKRNEKGHKTMQKTIIHKVRLTQKQSESLKVLKSYDVNVSQFIRMAIKEKLAKDWKSIKEKKERVYCPF
jgi:post-segregation antitoxin (ccd killing protein)